MAKIYCPGCAKERIKTVLLDDADLIQGWAIQKCKRCGALVKMSVDPKNHVDSHILTKRKPAKVNSSLT